MKNKDIKKTKSGKSPKEKIRRDNPVYFNEVTWNRQKMTLNNPTPPPSSGKGLEKRI